MAGSCWCWLIEQRTAWLAAALLYSSTSPSLFPRCPGSTHSQHDKESWALLFSPQCNKKNKKALSLLDMSTLLAILFALHLFLSTQFSFFTFPHSLHNMTFAMWYPYLPFMGEVAMATMDSTCLSTTKPLSLSPSLSFSPFSCCISLSCHTTDFTLF